MSRTRYVHGLHVVETLLKQAPERILRIGYDKARTDARMRAVLDRARMEQIAVEPHGPRRLDQYADGGAHQGVIALARLPQTWDHAQLLAFAGELRHTPLYLALDGVVDPHNLGACLRSAEALGVDAVIVPRHEAVGLNATVCKVSCGAADLVPVAQVTNLKRTLGALKEIGCWVYGAMAEAGQPAAQTDLTGASVLVLGGEGRGLRPGTRDVCDHLLGIPMQGLTPSLNVSVAAGVLAYEALRQRGFERMPGAIRHDGD